MTGVRLIRPRQKRVNGKRSAQRVAAYLEPHPEEPRSSRGVSKDGRESIRCGHPSRRIGFADAPQDEGFEG